jgi:hypothetical protein
VIRSILRKQIRKFSAHYGYDTTYMEDMLDADTAGAVKLAMASGFLQHKFGLAPDVYYTAKIRSAQAADCGPCTRLAVTMAEEAGMPRKTALTVATGGPLDGDLALARRYADQVIADDPALIETVEQVRDRFGTRGLNGLAAAVVAGQFYPLLKRGLGHATACEPVVDGFRRELAGAANTEAMIGRPAA